MARRQRKTTTTALAEVTAKWQRAPTTADAPATTAKRRHGHRQGQRQRQDSVIAPRSKARRRHSNNGQQQQHQPCQLRRQDSDDQHRRQHSPRQNTGNLPRIENTGWHPRPTMDTHDGTAATDTGSDVSHVSPRRRDNDNWHRRQHGRRQHSRRQNTSNVPGIENTGWHP